jgi:hypothetical protein
MPEAAYLCPRLLAGQEFLKALYAVEIVGRGIEQFDDPAQMGQKVATSQIACVEVPDPGAPLQGANAGASIEDFTLPMSALWRNRQDRGDVGGVEFVAHEPQGDKSLR